MKDVPESSDVCVVPATSCADLPPHEHSASKRLCVLCVQLKFHKDIVVCLCLNSVESRGERANKDKRTLSEQSLIID